MRLSVKSWPRKSFNRWAKSCTFHSSLASSTDRSSNSLRGLLALFPVCLYSLPPLRRHPPRLLPLLLVVGRGRNFEGSSSLSQPQVGGILGQHWQAWQSFGTDEWTVAVLRDGNKVPFHHLPPVSLEPLKLSSCSPGSVHALALQEEVSTMLQKGDPEPVDLPGPGFYSQLFLVEKVTGGLAARHRSVGSQRLHQTDKVQNGDCSVCVGVCQKGGLDVLDRPQRLVLPSSCPSGISAISLVLSRGTCLSVPCPVFQSVHAHSGFGVGTPEGRAHSSLPGRLAGHCGVQDPSAAASESGYPVVQGSGDHCQLREVRPKAVHSCPLSGDADRHVS